jgi:hypothetical protein
VEISCRVYRPRKPRDSPLYQLVERHLEELLRVWPERFARQHGPLRPVVERVLREFLRCGLLEHGFARLWCPECRRSVLVAFSCRGRSFCPSCEKKRQLLWAEWLCDEVLAPVAHRHVVLTIPRLLRPLFRRRRELLTELGRAAAEATIELVRRGVGGDARPGIVVSIASAGDLVQWHPHLHLLTTDGGKTADGSWQPLPEWNATLLMSLFRERLLARLVEAHAISPELVKKLLAWKPPGFSAHVAETIESTDKLRLEDTAASPSGSSAWGRWTVGGLRRCLRSVSARRGSRSPLRSWPPVPSPLRRPTPRRSCGAPTARSSARRPPTRCA